LNRTNGSLPEYKRKSSRAVKYLVLGRNAQKKGIGACGILRNLNDIRNIHDGSKSHEDFIPWNKYEKSVAIRSMKKKGLLDWKRRQLTFVLKRF